MTVSVRSGAVTDIGHVRLRNEDAVLAAGPVYAVADGMGGHESGDVASALAIARLETFTGAAAVDVRSVVAALYDANREIYLRAVSTSGEVMGTTIVGLALSRDEAADALLAFNVGDSRIYRYRGGTLVQLSEDHSVVWELMRSGELTAGEARSDSRRNVVTRALGVHASVEIDDWLIEPAVGDRYLLCSDGLTNEVTDELIAGLLAEVHDPTEAAGALVQMALDAGGRDNVSAVVVDIDAVGFTGSAVDADTGPRQPALTDADTASREGDQS